MNSKISSAGFPHGQENSGKTKKNDKSQVKMFFFFKSGKVLSIQIYKIPYTYMPSVGKNLIKNP